MYHAANSRRFRTTVSKNLCHPSPVLLHCSRSRWPSIIAMMNMMSDGRLSRAARTCHAPGGQGPRHRPYHAPDPIQRGPRSMPFWSCRSPQERCQMQGQCFSAHYANSPSLYALHHSEDQPRAPVYCMSLGTFTFVQAQSKPSHRTVPELSITMKTV